MYLIFSILSTPCIITATALLSVVPPIIDCMKAGACWNIVLIYRLELENEAWTPDLSTAKPGELYPSTLDYFQTLPNIAKHGQEGIGIAVDSLYKYKCCC